MSKQFDLSKYETIDTASFVVQNPKGGDLLGVDDKPVVIHVYGVGSKEYVNAKHRFDTASQARSISMVRNGKTAKPEDIAKDQAAFFAAVTQSIDNFPVSPIDLYNNPKLGYITAQVEKFLSETENFMPS